MAESPQARSKIVVPASQPMVAVLGSGDEFLRVGYISAPKKTVGADLYEPVGNQITSYVCASAVLGVKVTGSVIGRLTPTNKAVVPAKVFKLKFQQTGGLQEVPNLESGPVEQPTDSCRADRSRAPSSRPISGPTSRPNHPDITNGLSSLDRPSPPDSYHFSPRSYTPGGY